MTRNLLFACVVPMSLLAGCATLTGGDLVRDGEPTGTLIVENEMGFTLDTLTLSRCNAMSYGLDRLGEQDIPPNTRMSFTLGAGCWDIMVGRSGSCTQTSGGGQSCAWNQSPPRRFYISAGQTQVINYNPNN